MTLLPFEPPFFEDVGLPCTFVGHPVLESGADLADGMAFRERHRLDPNAPLLCILPGSRHGEVARLLEPFGGAAQLLTKTFPKLSTVIPAAPGLSERILAVCKNWAVPCLVVDDSAEKYDAMAACNVALAASGTVALELALAGVPMVISHRLHPITHMIVKRIVLVRFVTLINLLLDKAVVPELLQRRCRPKHLAAQLKHLMENESARAEQLTAGREALKMLRVHDVAPSDRAAGVVLDIIDASAQATIQAVGVTHDR